MMGCMKYKNYGYGRCRLPRKRKKNLKKAFGPKSYVSWKRKQFQYKLDSFFSDEAFKQRIEKSAASWLVCSSEVASALNEVMVIEDE